MGWGRCFPDLIVAAKLRLDLIASAIRCAATPARLGKISFLETVRILRAMFPIPGGPFAVPHGGLPPDLCPSCRPLRGVTRLPEPLQGARGPATFNTSSCSRRCWRLADRAVGPAVSRVKLDTASTTCRWQQDPRGATGCPRRLTFTLRTPSLPRLRASPVRCVGSLWTWLGEPFVCATSDRASHSATGPTVCRASGSNTSTSSLSKARGESDTAVRQLGELRPAKSALCNHRDDEAVDVATDGFQHIPGRR